MSRDDQTGRKAPNQGTMIRQTRFGVAAFNVPAIERFPPPEFLTNTQRNIWVAVLNDVPQEFFRARHLPMMIQYVRLVERMMKYSDQFEADMDDKEALSMFERTMKVVMRLETHLALNTGRLIDLVVRARTELKTAHQGKTAREAGESKANARSGLTYVGH